MVLGRWMEGWWWRKGDERRRKVAAPLALHGCLPVVFSEARNGFYALKKFGQPKMAIISRRKIFPAPASGSTRQLRWQLRWLECSLSPSLTLSKNLVWGEKWIKIGVGGISRGRICALFRLKRRKIRRWFNQTPIRAILVSTDSSRRKISFGEGLGVIKNLFIEATYEDGLQAGRILTLSFIVRQDRLQRVSSPTILYCYDFIRCQASN